MPKGIVQPAWGRTIAAAVAMMTATACTPLMPISQSMLLAAPTPIDALNQLAADLTRTAPGINILSAPSGPSGCGPTSTTVIRGAFPEHVLFATASDQPAPDAEAALNQLAERIRRDAPGSELTILGHTDAVGSDAYNMDLSRRRAQRVLHMLEAGGIAPDHLSAVAIGKRQPVAANDTPQGRALNRRVEFLISGCLAANLAAVQARPATDPGISTPVDVMRLDPSSAPGLATIDRVSLRQPGGAQPAAATIAPAPGARPPAVQPSASVARPAPAPHYQPKTLSPNAQQNPLGPTVPF